MCIYLSQCTNVSDMHMCSHVHTPIYAYLYMYLYIAALMYVVVNANLHVIIARYHITYCIHIYIHIYMYMGCRKVQERLDEAGIGGHPAPRSAFEVCTYILTCVLFIS